MMANIDRCSAMKRRIDIEEERIFENEKVENPMIRHSQDKFYWAVAPRITRHTEATTSIIRGRDVLEIGCSAGRDAELYSQYSRSYWGVDISDMAISEAEKKCLPSSKFKVCDAHALSFDDQSFDVVVVNSLLHHLDVGSACKEISRVLRPDGLLVFREPLGSNPLHQLYRLITPAARTADERPLSDEDIESIKQYFSIKQADYFGLMVLIAAYVRVESLRFVLLYLDDIISKSLFKRYFWQISGVCTKHKRS